MSILSALVVSRRPAICFAAMGAVWGTFAAYVPVIKDRIGASDAEFGLALLCSAIGLLTALWLAPRIDRWMGAWALPLAGGALTLAFLGPGFAPSLGLFAVAMLFKGMMSGLSDVLMNARVSELEARFDRSLMNVNHAMFSVAYALAAILSGIFREYGVGPEWAYPIVALVIIASVPFTHMHAIAAAETAAGVVVARGLVFWGGVIVLLAFMVENATEAWSALHIERTLGGSGGEGALGPGLLGLTMAAGRLAGQGVAERLQETDVIRGAALVTALGAALAALAPSIWLAYLGFAILGLGVSVIAPMALALVGKRCDPAVRTATIAKTAVIGFLGFFIGPPAMGFVSEFGGLRMSFSMIALAMVLLPLALVPLRRS